MTKCVLVLLATLASGVSVGDTDYNTARKLRESGDILPLETILQKLKKTHPGKVLEVEIDSRHGRMLYEIEILDNSGKVMEYKIDPRTGDIVKQEVED